VKPGRDPVLLALVTVAVTALLLTALCETARAQEASVDVLTPCAVAYECVEDLTVANATLSWKFSFNPRRSAIYDIVQWTVKRSGKQPRQFVAQIASRRNGEHIVRYYRVYEHVRKRNWKRLWLRRTSQWQELERGSERHNDANAALGRLFGFAMALRHGAEPASLTF
jgi:hypothetical protein